MLLIFVETYDRNVDKLISETIEAPCCRRQNPFLFLIDVICQDIAEKFGFMMDVTETMRLCVKVLAVKCDEVVRQIMADEDVDGRMGEMTIVEKS